MEKFDEGIGVFYLGFSSWRSKIINTQNPKLSEQQV
jgi:hypothetical protein